MINLAPISLFVYNRPEHTRRTLEYLVNNEFADKSQLFIFSDGAKSKRDNGKVEQVRNYIKTIQGFSEIVIKEREKNLGLAKSIISGVSEVLNIYDSVIVLEDDLISSPFFLRYMNDLISFYENDKKIYSVTGYSFPIKIPANYEYDIYLSPRASSWGWGTWKNRWEKVDWEMKDLEDFMNNKQLVSSFELGGEDLSEMLKNQIQGKIDSWSVIWSYTHFKGNAFCVYPIKSRIANIGTDKSGVHVKKTRIFNVTMNTTDAEINLIKNIEPDEQLLKNFRKFFKKNILSLFYKKLKVLFPH